MLLSTPEPLWIFLQLLSLLGPVCDLTPGGTHWLPCLAGFARGPRPRDPGSSPGGGGLLPSLPSVLPSFHLCAHMHMFLHTHICICISTEGIRALGGESLVAFQPISPRPLRHGVFLMHLCNFFAPKKNSFQVVPYSFAIDTEGIRAPAGSSPGGGGLLPSLPSVLPSFHLCAHMHMFLHTHICICISTEGIRALAGRALWLSSPSLLGHSDTVFF